MANLLVILLLTGLVLGTACVAWHRLDDASADRGGPRRPRARRRPVPVVVADRSGMPIEPAVGLPGVPAGLSLEQYAAGGLRELRIMLVQQARRRL